MNVKTQYDLSQLEWKLSGWIPELWRMDRTMEIGASPNAEVPAIPARIPGSVQQALRESGILPDWNVGLNYRDCEWVENRHWIYETRIPDEWVEPGKTLRLNCLGLDYCGEVQINGQLVSEFRGSHVPYTFDLTSFLAERDNVLRIIFTAPPRWLGQFGYTSKMKEWKVRFNYTWDWTVRLVQIGIWDSIFIEATDGLEITDFRCATTIDISSMRGTLLTGGKVPESNDIKVLTSLSYHGSLIAQDEIPSSEFNDIGVQWEDLLAVEPWWPNMQGEQPLYDLTCMLLDSEHNELDRITRRLGFKSIEWASWDGAPENADPWVCVVNGQPTFLQGVNWVPVLPNFADVTESQYRKLLELYKDLGLNVLRVWGGAFLEKQCFYDICDELGLMVWQEFPLSSSGVDNYPPDDPKSIEEMAAIAETYVARRHHHVSLLAWSGGNELMNFDGTPVDESHPMIARLQQVVEDNDPAHRFMATSASGPTEWVTDETRGKGMHWDVHGPWKADGNLAEGWSKFWDQDDALFRSETGAPSCSSAEIIRKYAGNCDPMPCTPANPLWRRTSVWWIESAQFVAELGHEPESLEEYVEWQQARQTQALSIAAKTCKERFPACGGFIIWMGHDCFPCTANTAIIDFEGNPKPAALALREIFRNQG